MLSRVTPGRRALWVGGVVLMAGACVTYDVEPQLDSPLEQQTVVAQLPTNLGGAGPVDIYYRSIVDQIGHAYLERNLESLQTLVARYDDPRAPAWARDLLPRYQRTMRTHNGRATLRERKEACCYAPGPMAESCLCHSYTAMKSGPESNIRSLHT